MSKQGQDAAQRGDTERALRETEARLRATLDATADGILAVDDRGKVMFANKRFVRMWRIPPDLMDAGDDDELLAFVLDQLCQPDAFLKRVRELYGTLREGFDVLEFRDGRVFERSSCPLVSGDSLIGRVWSFRDITERVRAEEAHRRSEERYRLLVENIPGKISELSLDGRILYTNRAVSGRSVEEVIGTSAYDYMPEEQHHLLRNALGEAKRTGKNTYYEASILTPVGATEWACHVCPIWEGDQITRFLVIGTDITEKKRSEEQRRALAKGD